MQTLPKSEDKFRFLCICEMGERKNVHLLMRAFQAEFKKEDVRILGFHPGGFRSQLHVKAGSDLNPEDLMQAPFDLA